jgi:hypothetical protein
MRYLAAAFNARPFGTPIPPNWLGLAAFGLLGGLLNPGFLLIGAGVEVAYLWSVSQSPRFRALVDGQQGGGEAARFEARHQALLAALWAADRQVQDDLEARCSEIVDTLSTHGDASVQADGLAELAWLHLRLLAARAALGRVVDSAAADADALAAQERRVKERLASTGVDEDLRRTLGQQAEVLAQRRATHAEARRRRERVDAELERIRQQVALLREQALLATGEDQVARSVDALTASLEEANRWLQEEDALLGDLDLSSGPSPAALLRRRAGSLRGEKT